MRFAVSALLVYTADPMLQAMAIYTGPDLNTFHREDASIQLLRLCLWIMDDCLIPSKQKYQVGNN